MKKLVNDPATVVLDTVRGLEAAHRDLVRAHRDPLFVARADAPVTGKVGLVSGGGSGHEPLHTGFVGRGMLDAAVPGPVFTSPTPEPVLAAIKAADGGAGVLLVVKNYTGDVLNFETAAELAAEEGIEVATVLVDDDVAVDGSTFTAGRRGVAGTLLVEKIAGAAAEARRGLGEVRAVAARVVERTASMGLALEAGTVPHVGAPSFELAEDEAELGIGIHGEPGRRRIPTAPADALTDQLLAPVLEDLAPASGEEVLLFVNGMGGTPLAELYVVFARAHDRLAEAGLTVTRALVGPYVTSLEMRGVSVTVLRLDEELTDLWDAPVHTPSLRKGC